MPGLRLIERLAALRAEMAEQESRWKESYDLLLAENEKLKSSGAEALLAAQWRHRYEACLKEKEDAVTNLDMEKEKVVELQDMRKKADAGKYESKYRDLKVSLAEVQVHWKLMQPLFDRSTNLLTRHSFLHNRSRFVCTVKRQRRYSWRSNRARLASRSRAWSGTAYACMHTYTMCYQ